MACLSFDPMLPTSEQAIAFFSQFVEVCRDREIAVSGWSYFVPLSSSIEFEEEAGRWMHAQQFQRFALSMGCPLGNS